MRKNSKIYIAGHKGLVGSALVSKLKDEGFNNLLFADHSKLDLISQNSVENFFRINKPDYVFLAAAKVGGIYANSTYPAEFIFNNLQIQTNVIHSAWKYGVKKLLFLGSSCIYPKYTPQPIQETSLSSGYLEPTNEPYAIAKITGIIMCKSYNKQYGTNFISVMPTNLYGPNDNYHPMNSHVLPALIHRFHEAKINKYPKVTIWGTGTPIREFLYSMDLAEACILLMENYNNSDIINIGTPDKITIKNLAYCIKNIVKYKGRIDFDTSYPDGTLEKTLDCSKLLTMGWKPKINLNEGLKLTYADFLKRSISKPPRPQGARL